jgi:ABC-type nitrate/sulfonate/bicarbonate transport system permease component
MAAEIYLTILTGFGLGHLLHYGRELNAMDQVIGVMLVIVVIGLLRGSAFSTGDGARDEPEPRTRH